MGMIDIGPAADRMTNLLAMVSEDQFDRPTPCPEANLGATGRTFQGTNPNGTVFGFIDDHLHITADMRAGGSVIYGESFDRFGIAEALGHDADEHGPNGTLDVTGNLLRDGTPIGTHDTHGWPTFTGWPVHDTYTHQQTYYMWLKRAWKAGMRLVVAQTFRFDAQDGGDDITDGCDNNRFTILRRGRFDHGPVAGDRHRPGPLFRGLLARRRLRPR